MPPTPRKPGPSWSGINPTIGFIADYCYMTGSPCPRSTSFANHARTVVRHEACAPSLHPALFTAWRFAPSSDWLFSIGRSCRQKAAPRPVRLRSPSKRWSSFPRRSPRYRLPLLPFLLLQAHHQRSPFPRRNPTSLKPRRNLPMKAAFPFWRLSRASHRLRRPKFGPQSTPSIRTRRQRRRQALPNRRPQRRPPAMRPASTYCRTHPTRPKRVIAGRSAL